MRKGTLSLWQCNICPDTIERNIWDEGGKEVGVYWIEASEEIGDWNRARNGRDILKIPQFSRAINSADLDYDVCGDSHSGLLEFLRDPFPSLEEVQKDRNVKLGFAAHHGSVHPCL